jgi:hypothetical protein
MRQPFLTPTVGEPQRLDNDGDELLERLGGGLQEAIQRNNPARKKP